MARVDLETAKATYPSISHGVAEWVAFFETAKGQDAFGMILYDLYDETLAQDSRRRGEQKIGRRPRRDASSLADVMNTLFPEQYTLEPLNVALPKLMGGRTSTEFAAEIPISRTLLNYILTGKRTATLPVLEGMARVAGVQPWYWVEWRAAYLTQLIGGLYRDQPHLSITAMKRVRQLRGGGRHA